MEREYGRISQDPSLR